MTPAAVKASAGAVEHLLLVPVDDLAGALADLHVRGVRVVGAEADAALTHREADLRGPLALVVGHEGQGLGPAVRRRCDLLVRIPMRGRIASLNAAVAGSILLFEASGQRGEAPPPPSRPEETAAPPDAAVPSSAAPVVGEPPPASAAKRVRRAGTDGAPAGDAPMRRPAPKRARPTRTAADALPASAAPSSHPATPAGRQAAPVAPPADADLLPGGPPIPPAGSRVRRARKAAPSPSGTDAAPEPAVGRVIDGADDPAPGDAPSSKRRRAKA